MKITKAVITAAGSQQRTLPLQTLIDRDGIEKSVLNIIIEEVLSAGVDEICVVVQPGDESAYSSIAGDHVGRLNFVHQTQQLGHGHAVYCARDFVGSDPFLHLVGDHLYVNLHENGCAQRLVEVAEKVDSSVSTVQATRESLLPYYGVIGGRRQQGQPDLYQIESVSEKPTPTEAEQDLIIPGLRAGHYLCFFGMHALTATIFDILAPKIAAAIEQSSSSKQNVTLSTALAELPKREQYLALEMHDSRYDVGVKYGLLNAQLALALSGQDRDEVLSKLLEVLAQRELMASVSRA